jgi:hypothetical protein
VLRCSKSGDEPSKCAAVGLILMSRMGIFDVLRMLYTSMWTLAISTILVFESVIVGAEVVSVLLP